MKIIWNAKFQISEKKQNILHGLMTFKTWDSMWFQKYSRLKKLQTQGKQRIKFENTIKFINTEKDYKNFDWNIF